MSTAKFDTLSNVAGTQTVPVATVAQGSAKAWVNFNGTGTVAIRASFNVSSITDNGTGDYTVNFTNAMLDANYAISVTGGKGVAGGARVIPAAPYQSDPTTTACRINTASAANTATDFEFVNVAIFR